MQYSAFVKKCTGLSLVKLKEDIFQIQFDRWMIERWFDAIKWGLEKFQLREWHNQIHVANGKNTSKEKKKSSLSNSIIVVCNTKVTKKVVQLLKHDLKETKVKLLTSRYLT